MLFRIWESLLIITTTMAATPAKSTSMTNRKWALKARPTGIFTAAECCGAIQVEEVSLTNLGEEEIVVVVETLSIDAFLRTMLDEEAYHGAIELGATLPAMGIGVVVAAGAKAKLAVGKKVLGMLGAQSVARLVPGEMGASRSVSSAVLCD